MTPTTLVGFMNQTRPAHTYTLSAIFAGLRRPAEHTSQQIIVTQVEIPHNTQIQVGLHQAI